MSIWWKYTFKTLNIWIFGCNLVTITEIWNSHFAEILNTPNPRPRKDLNLFHVCFRPSCLVSKFHFLVIFGHFGPNFHFSKSIKYIISMKLLFNWPQFIYSGQYSIIHAFTALWAIKNKEMTAYLVIQKISVTFKQK